MSRVHACLECGEPRGNGDFCSSACRHSFNNRRKARGAEIYDLYMALRFERPLAKLLGVLQAISRLASNYRAEDLAQRAGRKSWRNPRTVLEERPYLKSVRIGR